MVSVVVTICLFINLVLNICLIFLHATTTIKLVAGAILLANMLLLLGALTTKEARTKIHWRVIHRYEPEDWTSNSNFLTRVITVTRYNNKTFYDRHYQSLLFARAICDAAKEASNLEHIQEIQRS